MQLTATPLRAALAGLFSALTWPLLWPLFSQQGGSSSMWLVLGTVLLVALPAHAFVLGFRPATGAAGTRGIDSALLQRVAAWLGAGAAGAGLLFAGRALA